MVDATSGFVELKAKCLSEKILFEDDKFLAKDDSLPEEIVKQLEKIIWLRPKEINKDAKLVHEKATKFDVKQGALGNCWFLGSMANLPKYQSVFEFVLPPENKDFNDDDYCGIFHFRFWYYGQWVEVVIDDRLPTVNGGLIFVHSEHPNVFWSALLEKAYAKLHGSYKATVAGWTAESFEELTGGIGEYFNVKNETPKFFDYIQFCLENHCLVGCLTVTGKDNKENRTITIGIPDGHAYSLTGTKKISNEILLLRIRNPWGEGTEWKGAWADGSPQWNTLGQEEIEKLQLTFDADGEYWMNWEDFTKQFQDVEIGYLNPFCFCYKDETGKTPEEISPKFTYISGVWTAEHLFENAPGGDKEIGENENEEKNKENVEDTNENEIDGESKEHDGDIEENENKTKLDSIGTNEIAEENESGDSETKLKNQSEKENSEETPGKDESEVELTPLQLEKSLQYIMKVNKAENEDDYKEYKIIICLIMKNRRLKTEPLIIETDMNLYHFDNTLGFSSLNKTFFEENKHIEPKRSGFNNSEEGICYFNLKAGDYAIVLSSKIEAGFTLRVYSTVDVQIHPLVSQLDVANEIDF